MSDDDDFVGVAGRRGRRKKREDSSRTTALEILRNARAKGEKAKMETCEPAPLYDEVDEAEYSKIIKGRQDDDWIVDDNGTGYADDGREIFDDFEQEDLHSSRKKRSSKKENLFKSSNPNVRDPSGTAKVGIKNFFGPAAKPKEEKNISVSNDNLLDEMLGQLHDTVETVSPKIRPLTESTASAHCSSSQVMNPFAKNRQPQKRQPTSPLKVPSPLKPNPTKLRRPNIKSPVKQVISPVNEQENNYSNEQEASELLPDVNMTFEETDNAMAVLDLDDNSTNVQTDSQKENELLTSTTVVQSRGFLEKEEKSHNDSNMIWESSVVIPDEDLKLDKLESQIDRSQVPLTKIDGQEFLQIYWLDAYEDVVKNPGTAYIFGRVWSEQSQSYVSCCVIVRNIERVVYFLPRQTRLLKGVDTEEEVAFADLYNEVQSVFMNRLKVDQFKCKTTSKYYAFNDPNVPVKSDYLEVHYSSKHPALPGDLTGDNFSKIFGSNTTALEHLLLDRSLRGPGWILIKNPKLSKPPVSWCTFEVTVDGLQSISVSHDQSLKMPTVCAVSFNLVAVPNAKTREDEIVSASLLVYRKHQLDKPFPKTPPSEFYCFFTKPSSSVLPFDFKQQLQKQNMTKFVEVVGNERALLSLLLVKIQTIDPDILMGHDLVGYGLGLLTHRLSAIKVPNWSRISRLRRSGGAPKLYSSKAAHTDLMVGRLCADSKLAAMELVRSRSYDLTTLVGQILEKERTDILNSEIGSMYSSSQQLINLIRWIIDDSFYVLRIMSELNAIQLFLQITQIAGGIMSRTLMGGRSERNEYLLLHAFYDKSYICPDKQSWKKRQALAHITQESHNQENDVGQPQIANASRKKPSYTGGLVLEPKKGLYDTYILLLDFNSLYPSIIQEFNICFTTVKLETTRADSQEEVIPEVPDAGLEPGILPTEIRKLVESRRQVKKLMKEPNLTPEQSGQYNIRQLALKLTANSMYGCLGFAHSRFFAKPLAALVTAKGREILMHTKELVEKTGLSVIYGDTDSIMINTNSRNFDEVMALGRKVKSEVNRLYRLLELDIDGVYKSLLLLKKKKYAGLALEKMADGTQKVRREMKGLDIVRRDWSDIARDAGIAVLDDILSEKSRDDIIESIHQYLTSLGEKIKNGNVELEKFQISKQLTKSPTEYTDKKAQAHVTVALRLNAEQNYHLKQGDTVAYVICQDGSTNSVAQRAYHINELKQNQQLKIDTHYYLSQQVHPVVSRLCEPIEGTDSAQIAQCLGLDPTSYRQRIAAAHAAEEEEEEDIAIGPTLDYSQCEPFTFTCFKPDCNYTFVIDNAIISNPLRYSLDKCPSCKSHPLKMVPVLVNLLDVTIRKLVDKYYEENLICDDITCAFKARAGRIMVGQNGKPMCSSCKKSTMHSEMSEKMLYTQLSYFQGMFDLENAFSELVENSDEKKKLVNLDLKEQNIISKGYGQLYNCATKWCNRNAYSEVDLGSIFRVLNGNLL